LVSFGSPWWIASAMKISITVNTANAPIMIENWRTTLWSDLLMEPLTHVLLSVDRTERHDGCPTGLHCLLPSHRSERWSRGTVAGSGRKNGRHRIPDRG
jgi:hypothetical protein